MATNRLIEAEWQSFVDAVMPPDAGPTQRQEMRRSFYGGALSLFSLIMRTLDPGDEPTDADLARMDQIDAELRQFRDDVEAGRA